MATLKRAASRRFSSWRSQWLPIVCVALAVASPPAGSAQTLSEYGLKAVFLFNFTKFVEWPNEAFAAPNAPLCIGVLGDDPFGELLDEAVRGEISRGHPLTVRRARDVMPLRECHVVFISRSEESRVAEILEELDGVPTLTVGDSQGFARLGGVIGFYLEGNKLRFEISHSAARRKELKISSQLLSLGKIVEQRWSEH